MGSAKPKPAKPDTVTWNPSDASTNGGRGTRPKTATQTNPPATRVLPRSKPSGPGTSTTWDQRDARQGGGLGVRPGSAMPPRRGRRGGK